MRFYISECTFCFWTYFQCGSEWLNPAILLPHFPVCWEHRVHHPPCQALNISYCHESLFFRVRLKSQVIHLKLQQTDSVCSLVFPIKGGREILALPSVVILQTSRYTDYLINFLNLYVCFACMYICLPCACLVPMESRRRGQNWSSKWLLVTMWVLGIEHCAISLSLWCWKSNSRGF